MNNDQNPEIQSILTESVSLTLRSQQLFQSGKNDQTVHNKIETSIYQLYIG